MKQLLEGMAGGNVLCFKAEYLQKVFKSIRVTG